MTNITEIYTHERIKYLLRENGSSLPSLARELSVSPASVSNTSNGRSVSQKIQNAIASKLDLEACEIWPNRYLYAECQMKVKNRLES